MAHIRCDFRSETLDMGTSMIVFLPEHLDCSKVNVVYLLHGLTDNCTGWARYTSVERYARRYDVAVVIPEVQRSFYADMKLGLPYFTFISKELPQMCSNMFGLSREKAHNYIMGLSMGGYGSIKTALNNIGCYNGCASFSGVVDIADRVANATAKRAQEFKTIFGDSVPKDCNPLAMLSELKSSKNSISELPRFYITCGKQDDFISQNEEFALELKKAGADCTFESWDGMHDWDFFDTSVEKAFDFFFGNQKRNPVNRT